MSNMLLKKQQEQKPRQDELNFITTPSALANSVVSFSFGTHYTISPVSLFLLWLLITQ
jgi:hypothetical protein